MKEKILEISNKLRNGELNIEETRQQFLFLFGVSGSTLTAKEAALEILEWIKSDDCWVTDKDGNKLPDAIIDGKDLNKRLDKYYR